MHNAWICHVGVPIKYYLNAVSNDCKVIWSSTPTADRFHAAFALPVNAQIHLHANCY